MEKYYSANAKVDQHNRIRQDDLKLERKVQTLDWSKRVNLSVLGIICVDTLHMWSSATDNQQKTKDDFFIQLATELIDNDYDGRRAGTRRPRVSIDDDGGSDGASSSGRGIYLTPTKRMRKNKDGKETTHRYQGHCVECGAKSTWTCSRCVADGVRGEHTYFCRDPKKARACFATHVQLNHEGE